jgi:hypothetical protein
MFDLKPFSSRLLVLTVLAGLLLTVSAIAADPEEGTVSAPEDAFKEAAMLEAVRPVAAPVAGKLMEALSGRLMEAMGTGGPKAAISVCRDEAMVLSEAVRREKGIPHLKRVGVRVRNPENAPDPHEAAALAHFTRKGVEEGQYPAEWVQRVTLSDGQEQLRYYRAIPLQARCVGCHGPKDQIPGIIRDVLAEAYPEDAATGFEPGQLRGLMVVGLDPETIEKTSRPAEP